MIEQMLTLKRSGVSYREIGGRYGLTGQRVYQLLKGQEIPALKLMEIEDGQTLATYLRQTGRIHLHRTQTKQETWHWDLVHRSTGKCGTRACVKLPLSVKP